VRIDEYAIPVITRRHQPRRRPGPRPGGRLHRKQSLDVRMVVPVYQRKFLASAVRLHQERAFSVQLTWPYALEVAFMSAR